MVCQKCGGSEARCVCKASSKKEADNDDDGKLKCMYCMSSKGYAKSWIGCDTCDEWVHIKCENKHRDKNALIVRADEDVPYLCPKCRFTENNNGGSSTARSNPLDQSENQAKTVLGKRKQSVDSPATTPKRSRTTTSDGESPVTRTVNTSTTANTSAVRRATRSTTKKAEEVEVDIIDIISVETEGAKNRKHDNSNPSSNGESKTTAPQENFKIQAIPSLLDEIATTLATGTPADSNLFMTKLGDISKALQGEMSKNSLNSDPVVPRKPLQIENDFKTLEKQLSDFYHEKERLLKKLQDVDKIIQNLTTKRAATVVMLEQELAKQAEAQHSSQFDREKLQQLHKRCEDLSLQCLENICLAVDALSKSVCLQTTELIQIALSNKAIKDKKYKKQLKDNLEKNSVTIQQHFSKLLSLWSKGVFTNKIEEFAFRMVCYYKQAFQNATMLKPVLELGIYKILEEYLCKSQNEWVEINKLFPEISLDQRPKLTPQEKSSVLFSVDTSNGKTLIAKRFETAKISHQKRRVIRNVVIPCLAACFSHPSIVNCEGWFRSETDNAVYVLFERCECDLAQWIKNKTGPSNAVKLNFASQLAKSLKTFHKWQLCWGNLKFQDILVSGGEAPSLKISYFGISKEESKTESSFANTAAKQKDIYALGGFLRSIWEEETEESDKIPPYNKKYCYSVYADLIRLCLYQKSEKRPSARDVCTIIRKITEWDSKKTLVVYSDQCGKHRVDEDKCFEVPDRITGLRPVITSLKKSYPDFCSLEFNAPPAQESHLTRAHTRHYVEHLRNKCEDTSQIAHYTQNLSGEENTFVCNDSYSVACHAAGCVVLAVDEVLKNTEANKGGVNGTPRYRNAICAIRPPGHHAHKDRAEGYCLINNVAIGACYALDKGLRVAVVDFDLHHGDGSEDILQHEKNVLFISSHYYDGGFFPASGPECDKTDASGAGIINVNLPKACDSRKFRNIVLTKIIPALFKFKPQIIMLSAGFDAHKNDPMASNGPKIKLQISDFHWITKEIMKVQENVVSVLEGGYNQESLQNCFHAHVCALLGITEK